MGGRVSNSCAPFHAAAAVNNWLATCQPQCPTCMSGDSFQCLTQCIYVCVCLWFVVQVDTASENVPHCQMRHIGKCPGWGWGGERVMRCECSPPQWLIHPCTCLQSMVAGWLKGDAGCILYSIYRVSFSTGPTQKVEDGKIPNKRKQSKFVVQYFAILNIFWAGPVEKITL